MHTGESNTLPNCLVCFSTIGAERTKNCEQFTKVFNIFCRLLKIDLIKPMQWNFEQDHVPFCEFCSSAVEKLKDLYDQIESLEQQTTNIIQRIKHEIQTSRSDDTSVTNELTSKNRVNYFRHLVVKGSFTKEDCGIKADITSFNVDAMATVETELDTQSSFELSFLEGIDEPCEIEDADIESDPLLTVKHETDDFIDIECFPQDNMDEDEDSKFLDQYTPVSSAQEIYSVADEIKKTDLEGEQSCQFCEKSFWTKLSLKLHLKQHLDKKNINCGKCNETFHSRSDSILHQNRVHGSKLPKNPVRKLVIKLTRCDLPSNAKKPNVKLDKKKNFCEVCEKSDASSEQFSSLHSLTCYKRIHSGEMKYKCDYCDKTYRDRYLLIRHRRSHTGEKPFKCELCGKLYQISVSLRKHMRSHTGERPFKCGVCLKTFSFLTTLSSHRRIHTGEKPFKCNVCNKSFTYSGAFTQHTRIHTGGRPYKCEICPKTFAQTWSLTCHKRIHTGEKPFKCEVCNKLFICSAALVNHKRIHTGEKPFKCKVCLKAFSLSKTLVNHNRIHTGEKPFKCDVCDKSFTQSSGLTSHKRTHA